MASADLIPTTPKAETNHTQNKNAIYKVTLFC